MFAIALSIAGATACIVFILFCIGVIIRAGISARDEVRRDKT